MIGGDRKNQVYRTGLGADIAFAVALLASYFAMFSSFSTSSALEVTLLIVLGTAYLMIGIYGYSFAGKSGQLKIQLLYFAVQLLLGAAIIYLSKGSIYNALILLPLAGHSVVMLPPNASYLVNLAITLAFSIGTYMLPAGWSGLVAILPTFLTGQIFIVVFTQMAISEERARKEVERLFVELEMANHQLREYAAQVEDLAIANERNRLAREIHDGLGHYLTTIHMQIQAGRAVIDQDPERARKAFLTAQSLAQEALQEVRRSVFALRESAKSSLGLEDSIQELIRTDDNPGLDIEFKLLGEKRPLAAQAQLTLFRAVQEGMNNVRKHANASHVWIELDFSPEQRVRLSFRDDGVGSEDPTGGFGLIGLKERVQLINGDVQISSAPGQGFLIEVVVPG